MPETSDGTWIRRSDGRTARAMALVEPTTDRQLPAWPVLWLLWGVPIWWVLGLFPFSAVVLSPVMVFYLLQRRRLVLVPGTIPFYGLVAWMALGPLVLDSSDKFGFLVKFGLYVAAAIVILYVSNAPEQVTRPRVLSGLTAMWVSVIVGGYLGSFFPYAGLDYTVGSLLPGSITSNPWAQDLFFPRFAEVQYPYGAWEPFLRPSAPFSFANGWGAAMSFLTPVAVGAALASRTTVIPAVVTGGLFMMVIPAVAANNRGMYLAVAVAAAAVMMRAALRGHVGLAVSIAALSVGAVAAMVQLGVVQTLVEREETGRSSEGRLALYVETFERTLLSPFMGYGAPRPSFSSEITVGTQGAVWAVMFCSGFVGLAFYLWFTWGAVFRTWRSPRSDDLWLNAALIAVAVMSLYYGIDRMLVPYGVLVAVLLRDRYSRRRQDALE